MQHKQVIDAKISKENSKRNFSYETLKRS